MSLLQTFPQFGVHLLHYSTTLGHRMVSLIEIHSQCVQEEPYPPCQNLTPLLMLLINDIFIECNITSHPNLNLNPNNCWTGIIVESPCVLQPVVGLSSCHVSPGLRSVNGGSVCAVQDEQLSLETAQYDTPSVKKPTLQGKYTHIALFVYCVYVSAVQLATHSWLVHTPG